VQLMPPLLSIATRILTALEHTGEKLAPDHLVPENQLMIFIEGWQLLANMEPERKFEPPTEISVISISVEFPSQKRTF